MYQASEAYLAALKRSDWKTKLNIEIIIGTQSYYLTEENVQRDSFEITNKCSDSDNVEIGKVNIAELTVTVINIELPRYALKGAALIPRFGLLTAGGYESIPLGHFQIAEADWTTLGIEITAYDQMSKLDVPIALTSAYGYIYDFVLYACTECGVTLGMTKAQMQALPNGSEYLNLYPENDMETYRDLIAWCALHTATFATFNRSGELVFVSYSQTPVDQVNSRQRVNGEKFSDFNTRYTAVKVTDLKNETVEYYAMEVDNGLTYDLGADPFLQNSSTREHMARNILDALTMIDYVPFEASMATAAIVYDLGDVITFTDGIADRTKMYCITQYDWNFDEEYYAKGVGQNPALANARGKTDKALIGVANRSGKGSSDFEIVTNLREVTVENKKRRRVLRASIMTAENAKVKMEAEIDITVAPVQQGTEIICSVTYQLDSEILTRHPVETWSVAGQHILSLMYALAISKDGFHSFDIFLEMDGGDVTIEPYDIQATFSGLGIVVDPGWNGQIELEDDAPTFAIPRMGFDSTAYGESITTVLITPERIVLNDDAPTFAIPRMGFNGAEYVDSVGIGDYVADMTWEEVQASTWGTIKENYIWGQNGGS